MKDQGRAARQTSSLALKNTRRDLLQGATISAGAVLAGMTFASHASANQGANTKPAGEQSLYDRLGGCRAKVDSQPAVN